MNWHFYKRLLARGAVYALIRRGHRLPRRISLKFHELHSMVLDYIDDLQLLVPGATVILVVSHVYSVMREQLDSQCLLVQIAVRNFLCADSGMQFPAHESGSIAQRCSGSAQHPTQCTLGRRRQSSARYDAARGWIEQMVRPTANVEQLGVVDRTH